MGFISRKKVAAAAAVATVAMGGVVAYAFWTTTGAGSGSANAASSNGTVTLYASFAPGIYPGGTESVSFTADNGGATDLEVRTIHLASVSVDSGHSSCVVGDFSMADVTSNTVVPHASTGYALTGSGSLVYVNDPVNSQDACKGATITLNLTSN